MINQWTKRYRAIGAAEAVQHGLHARGQVVTVDDAIVIDATTDTGNAVEEIPGMHEAGIRTRAVSAVKAE